MIEVETKTNIKAVEDYLRTHNHSFKSKVGWFDVKPRKEAKEGNHSYTSYGLARRKKKLRSKISNAEVVYKNVYGDAKSPARNFFLLAGSKKYWDKNNFSFLTKYFNKTADVEQTLRAWENLSKAVLRRAIRDFSKPKNSSKTVAIKGFNNPLIDTQQMLNSLEVKSRTDEK